MLWITGKYVKVWEVEVKGKMVKIKLGTSDKQQDGTYKNSNWNSIFIGNCFDSASELQKGDVIEIEKGKIENIYNKEKGVNYLNLVVFAFNKEGEVKQKPKKENKKAPVVDEFDEDEFPF